MITLKKEKVTEPLRSSDILDAAIKTIEEYLERKFSYEEKNVLSYVDEVRYDPYNYIVSFYFNDEIPKELFEMFDLVKNPEEAFESDFANCETLEIHFSEECLTWGTD